MRSCGAGGGDFLCLGRDGGVSRRICSGRIFILAVGGGGGMTSLCWRDRKMGGGRVAEVDVELCGDLNQSVLLVDRASSCVTDAGDTFEGGVGSGLVLCGKESSSFGAS